MTEESDKNKPTSPEKLLIDNPSNFQFHAAYLTNSDIYDKTANLEARKLLNQNITALQQNQIDCSTFYSNINQYRAEDGSQHYGRTFIRTQRKGDWRREMQKQERNKRHKR